MRSPLLHPYAEAVLVTTRRRRLLGPEDRVLVALSAGPDSTALLAALVALRDAGVLAHLAALHVDHGLRPGEADAACAAAACARLGVPFRSVAVTVAPGNVQAEARRARYAALRAEAERIHATRIATGHTRTDQAETLLLRLLRGAGARGLSGIPPRRGVVIRPLIDRSRAEGLSYLEDLGLAWRDDPTNATPRFARNRLRLGAWPALLALAPAAERALGRAADLLREDERALSARARRRVGDEARASAAALRREPLAVRRRVIRRLWRNATGARALDARHVEAVLALLGRARPGTVSLPGGRAARCRYGCLEIVQPAPAPPAVRPVVVDGPGRYAIPELGVVAEIRVGRPEKVPWPAELRTRRAGDRLRRDGGPGSRTLKEWLIDRKIAREERDALLLLATPDGTVLAIPSLRVVAQGLGPAGASLEVRLSGGHPGGGSYCIGGAGLL